VATNPFIWLLNGAANRVRRLRGARAPSERAHVQSPEEIRMLVEQSEQRGAVSREDARLIAGVFEFSEKNAREVMTPRTAMVALPVAADLAGVADRVAAAGRSRYPVCGESLDDIVGVVHAKDILAALRQPGPAARLRELLRPAHFVPGTREVEDVLADMKRLKVHLAIVLDEFGGTAGLVTMEDLLEEIVGQIYDEYDRPEKASVTAESGRVAVAGATPLEEVNRRLGLALRSEDYATLGGYLFGALGRLPAAGDRVAVAGGWFEVTAMEDRRVASAAFGAAPEAATTP
jgi:putative hemolysin